jgi:hypothetical protein
MTIPWTLTFDCATARLLAEFWKTALGYVDAPPPTGWDTWADWLRHFDVPEDEWDDGAVIVDPDGVGPRINFLAVPEPKQVKNRVHVDVQVSGGRHRPADQRSAAILAKVEQLVAAGGSVLRQGDHDGSLDHVVMADPEGNEFCVV